MEFLPLLVGRARALELIIGGEDITAEIAVRIRQFDPVLTGQAKTMINERAPKPKMEHMEESRAAYI